MAELRYYRADKDRTDTCALLFPDTSGLMPSAESYEQLTAQLKEQLASKLASIDAQKLILPSSVAADVAGADQDSTTTAAATASGEGDGTPAAVAQQGSDAVGKEQVWWLEIQPDKHTFDSETNSSHFLIFRVICPSASTCSSFTIWAIHLQLDFLLYLCS